MGVCFAFHCFLLHSWFVVIFPVAILSYLDFSFLPLPSFFLSLQSFTATQCPFSLSLVLYHIVILLSVSLCFTFVVIFVSSVSLFLSKVLFLSSFVLFSCIFYPLVFHPLLTHYFFPLVSFTIFKCIVSPCSWYECCILNKSIISWIFSIVSCIFKSSLLAPVIS